MAHCPGSGVNVYVVVAELFIAGDQFPETPFTDVVGSGDTDEPLQIEVATLKVGTIVVFPIVMVWVMGSAHSPELGVKV